MNGIFAYAGKGNGRDILLDGLKGMKCKGNRLSGMAVLQGDSFAKYKTKGTPQTLYEKAKGGESGAGIGIAVCADTLRGKTSVLTAPPAVDGAFAVALDRPMDNFEELRRWCRGAFPIAGDTDLLLALLQLVKGETVLDILRRLLPSFQAELGFAFVSAAEEAVFARAGSVPFFVGIREDGYVLGNEAAPVLAVSQRYFLLAQGEYAKISRERVLVFDANGKRLKKAVKPVPAAVTLQEAVAAEDDLLYLAKSAKDTLGGIVKDGALDFSGLHLSRRRLEKCTRVVLTGCGAAYGAARAAGYFLEALTDLPCSVFPAGELQCGGVYYDRTTLFIAVTTDGEEDSIYAALKTAGGFGAVRLLFTAQPHSLCALTADMVVDVGGYTGLYSGTVSALLALALFAVWAGHENGVISDLYLGVAAKLAELLPGKLSAALKISPEIEKAAARLLSFDSILVTGSAADAAAALLGAAALRRTLRVNAFALPLSEAETAGDDLLPFMLAVGIVSSRERLQSALDAFRRLKAQGAQLLIFTTANLENELTEFENVITVNESLPVFDSITCLAAVYRAIALAREKLNEEAKEDKTA